MSTVLFLALVARQALAQPQRSNTPEDVQASGGRPARQDPLSPFPVRVAGFAFGSTLLEAKGACIEAGGEMSRNPDSPDEYICSSPPVRPFPFETSVRLVFCGDKPRVCAITLTLTHSSPESCLAVRQQLRQKYGPEGGFGREAGMLGRGVFWRWVDPEGLAGLLGYVCFEYRGPKGWVAGIGSVT
jgi:hypothetical protein